MEISVDKIQSQIPAYLTREIKENLIRSLNSFPDNFNYYTRLYPNDTLQGDGWSELSIRLYETGKRQQIRGIILSNSCDIDPENKRDLAPMLLFAPIIKLKAYQQLLEKAKVPTKVIKQKFNDIRAQNVYALFYLPKGAALEDEYIAVLDDIHSLPYQDFIKEQDRGKLFTLSQAGFYLFVLKLSVHFCRFSEQIFRDETV